ncbi:MAG: tRNA (adenosine(37)-N6)-dimethylallyltransferase MiaA [Saprospiraceae bacterium]|nr:tRNA (adenosine(37)-N6)-dimethylallyltransferase MiaA [Saprospiraceae bacterium]
MIPGFPDLRGSMKKYLIVIGGPTASGKTSVAIDLARHFKTEIISADSRQLFREMSIGTAVPDAQELAVVKHHLIQSRSVLEDYSVGEYVREVLPLLERLYVEHEVLVLVGGSGLYIQALCEGLDEFPDVTDAIKQELQQEFEHKGLAWLQEELQQIDPEYFMEVDRQNPVRLLRALSVYRASGKPYSCFRTGYQAVERSFTPIYFRLELDREILYNRINQRVDKMLEQGLLDEVRELLPHRSRTALQTVGYQELFDFLEGKHDFEQAVALIKQNSRRYAKRQETWFRRKATYQPFVPNDLAGMILYIRHRMDIPA